MVTLMVTALIIVITAGCKKDRASSSEKPNIPMPDSTMFVGTGNGDTTIIYLLNAANGSLVKKYSYRHNKQVDSYIPLVGNGFLYLIENTKINALNINTGAVMWSDSVKSATWMHTILHDDTFYGLSTIYYNSMAVYAMDATKQTNTFLWQYTLGSSYANTTTNITYYNGLVYISTNRSSTEGGLTVLDAKTGTVKWTLNTPCSVASLKNGIITSENNLIDATTSTVIGTVPSSLVLSNATQTASIIYANKDLFFTRVSRYANYTTTFKLNAYDVATNALKWSIKGGGYSVGYDTTIAVDQILNNQPIIKTDIGITTGIYGYVYHTIYSALDLNTGTEKWSYGAGFRGQNFQVDNTMYSCGTFTLNLAAGLPASSTITAADLNTGKIKWTNNNLYFSIGGSVAACISVKGKGYSSEIQ